MGSKRARRYRQHSAADKVAILRKVLLEGQAVSAVCEEHDVSPALFYTWQKQFFENGTAAFAKDTSTEQRALERTVEDLRERLQPPGVVLLHEVADDPPRVRQVQRRLGAHRFGFSEPCHRSILPFDCG